MNFNVKNISSYEKAHQSFISSMSFNPKEEDILASACNINNNIADDRTIKLWRVSESGLTPLNENKLHLFGVNALQWNSEGLLLASGGNDCNLNIFDVNRGKLNRNFRLDSPVTCVDFNFSSNLILVGTYDNQILLYDVRSKNIISQILAHSEPITSVYFSGDSTVMLSSSYDGFCRLWDTFKGICLKTIVLEKSPSISHARFLPDMNHLLISTLNNQIQVVNLYEDEEVIKYSGHQHSTYLLDTEIMQFEQDRFLISGSEDYAFYIWDVATANCQRKDMEVKNLNCLATNNNGVICASGFPDQNNIYIMKFENNIY